MAEGSLPHTAVSAAATIRDARPSDAGRIRELLTTLGYPTSAEDVERAMSEPGTTLLVADAGGAVVGVLVGAIRWQLHLRSKTGSIDALVVDPDHRSAGIGESLVEAFIAGLERQGVPRVEVHSNARRTRAHSFYERLGFEANSVYFIREVGHPADDMR